MAIMDIDPVMSGFQQPKTMTPRGQLAAYKGQRPGYNPPLSRSWAEGVGIGAGAGVVGGESFQAPGPGPLPTGPIASTALAGLSALGIAIPEPITTALGIAGGAYLAAQAFGLGEGEGIFGVDLFGGDTQTIPGTPIELGGPGLAEPGPGTGWMLLKEWHVNYDWGTLQYYLIQKMGSKGKHTNRWIALYNTNTKEWKAWRWISPKLAVIGKNMPRHQMLTRLRRNLKRHTADARTILKLVSPTSLRAPRRRRRR